MEYGIVEIFIGFYWKLNSLSVGEKVVKID